ncbi:MAG: prolipoprotein diacylglyceryl transferase [Clostridia bacterium]|nr:prolipoprotein diacylglyceryl transferase [Clostridia bacterium]
MGVDFIALLQAGTAAIQKTANDIVYYIAFPHLGIHLNVSPVAFELGPFKVHWYGIIIAAAILVALTLAIKETKKFDIKEDDLVDMFLIALPVSIIFARLFFVIFTWSSFKNDLLGIFRIWEGGLAIYGAVIGAVLSVYIFSRIKKIDMLHWCDFACVYLPLAQAIGRWGNFFNQELYGKNTDLPWGMTGNIIQNNPDPGVNGQLLVHPTFLYESLLNLGVFAILYRLRKNRKVKGSVFAWYLILYSTVRFMMEFLRTDAFGVGTIRYNQVFAAAVLVCAVIWLMILSRRSKKAIEEEEELAPSPYASVIDKMEKDEEQEKLTQSADSFKALENGEAPDTSEEGVQQEGASIGTLPENRAEETDALNDALVIAEGSTKDKE